MFTSSVQCEKFQNPYFQLFWNIQHTIVNYYHLTVHRAKSLLLLSSYSFVSDGPLSSLPPAPQALFGYSYFIMCVYEINDFRYNRNEIISYFSFVSGLFHIIFSMSIHIITNNNIYF